MKAELLGFHDLDNTVPKRFLTDSKNSFWRADLNAGPTLTGLGARLLGAIHSYNSRHEWTPRGHLVAIARELAAYLTAEEVPDLLRRIVTENREILAMAETEKENNERLLQETIQRLVDSGAGEGGPGAAIIQMLENEEPGDMHWLQTVVFKLLFEVGKIGAAFWEKVPPLDVDMEIIRGRGIACEIGVLEELSEDTYLAFAEWDDDLQETHALADNTQMIISELSEKITQYDELLLELEDKDIAAVLQNVFLQGGDEERRMILATQIALRMHQRSFPQDSPLQNEF